MDAKHSYQKDYAVQTHSMETAGPIMNTEHRHNFKHQLDMPHKRDLVKEGHKPTYEVDKSHHYHQSKTHRSDLSEMVGPIYKTNTKHSYTGGYITPRTRSLERDTDAKKEKQQKLVSKYFAKDASKSVIKRESVHEFVKQEQRSHSEVRQTTSSQTFQSSAQVWSLSSFEVSSQL